MRDVPYEVTREVLTWLPGGSHTSECRHVCHRWDTVLRGHVTPVCVHRYCAREMTCKVLHVLRSCSVGDVLTEYADWSRGLERRKLAGKQNPNQPASPVAAAPAPAASTPAAVPPPPPPPGPPLSDLELCLRSGCFYSFPHCLPLRREDTLSPTLTPTPAHRRGAAAAATASPASAARAEGGGRRSGCGGFRLTRPSESVVEAYCPVGLLKRRSVAQVESHRWLLTDRSEGDPYFATEDETFAGYMKLLLKFQLKHQEYSFEHRARLRLLRTYIHNLENRVHCKIKLLLEQVGYLCIRHKVLLLPFLEESLREGLELRCAAVKLQLTRYRVIQEQVELQKRILTCGGDAATPRLRDAHRLAMPELERYATFLCTSDDALDGHVDRCRVDPLGASSPPDAAAADAAAATSSDEQRPADDLSSLPIDVTVQPGIIVMLKVCFFLLVFLLDFFSLSCSTDLAKLRTATHGRR